MLLMKNISKHYDGVTALDDVTFEVEKGKIHGLVGGNGAGKSTLMRILAGAEQPDSGEIFLDGEKVEIHDPKKAIKLGIAIIYQELNIALNLNAVQNVFLGREIRNSFGMMKKDKMTNEVKALFETLNFNVDITKPARELSVAQQQMIEIAKALHQKAEILVMDEPSAPLTDDDIERMFEIVLSLKEKGVTIIYISHRLEELYEICDGVTVLRDGKIIDTKAICDVEPAELVRMMINKNLDQIFPDKSYQGNGKEVLRVENLKRTGVLNDISISVHEGEIVGIAGLMGSGRTELVRAIYGADKIDSGQVYINGEKVRISSPFDAVKNGIAMVQEDRKEQGVILKLSIRNNVTLSYLPIINTFGFVQKQAEEKRISELNSMLRIKCNSFLQPVSSLSGGNQQKVAIAKCLARNSKVIIFDEPTRGIDVGAKTEIYNFLRMLANEGVAVIMVSSEMPEILGMCDRIYIMYNGSIGGEMTCDDACQENILSVAMGSHAKLCKTS